MRHLRTGQDVPAGIMDAFDDYFSRAYIYIYIHRKTRGGSSLLSFFVSLVERGISERNICSTVSTAQVISLNADRLHRYASDPTTETKQHFRREGTRDLTYGIEKDRRRKEDETSPFLVLLVDLPVPMEGEILWTLVHHPPESNIDRWSDNLLSILTYLSIDQSSDSLFNESSLARGANIFFGSIFAIMAGLGQGGSDGRSTFLLQSTADQGIPPPTTLAKPWQYITTVQKTPLALGLGVILLVGASVLCLMVRAVFLADKRQGL
ncbi:hypothetical protein BU24DRAFT_493518 [Aaosphaeria arxii CBS 175.79]|uniref:Uncharacterized protein n=1 Tax=Aaosphaeria arxii CBS 175.79 TaxID=1450172 RepID=A0A6A5XP64_9PLEO|nr:uncharacterized protein BU24DRAFT_493518 [Aaosphaeria arxii CBS 175.79]KAF2015038.1 hypothetical protein BU24DRAFT_493518 [Aaosphaeria arxii CBS 175.79]